MSVCSHVVKVGNASDPSSCPTSSTYTSIADIFQNVVELYIIFVVCVIGLTGNLISLVVLSRTRERRHSMCLLTYLATADAFYMMVAFICYPLQHLMNSRENHLHMLLYAFPLLKIAQFICIWMMVLVTVDRYMYVKSPYRAETIINHHNKHSWAAGICVVAILYNLPRFFDSCVMTFYDNCTGTNYFLKVNTELFNSPIYFNIYEYGAYMVILYIGPLLLLLYMNTALIFYIKRALARKFKQTRDAYHNDHSDTKATQALVIIVVVFLICETPELIVKILAMLNQHIEGVSISIDVFKVFTSINELLMVVNSSVNFFVYLAFRKRFRMVLRNTFTMFRWQSPLYV